MSSAVTSRRVQDNAFNYDKGVLAEILEPIMGKGLIPADLETWKPRRRAIVPAFHKAYLEAMVGMFGRCTQQAIRKLDALTEHGQVCIHSLCCHLQRSVKHMLGHMQLTCKGASTTRSVIRVQAAAER